jgi:transcriptional regulator with XRE-family HTH domain
VQNLKNYLKQVMKEKSLTAVDIQKRSGNKIADSYISNILKGKAKNLTVAKLTALADGLGVDSMEVFKASLGEHVPVKADEVWLPHILLRTMEQIVLNPDLTDAVKTLVEMKPAKVKKALGLIKGLK